VQQNLSDGTRENWHFSDRRDVDIAKGYGNRCLVGKLWADKVVNKEALNQYSRDSGA
jgi:hypothetical protein